jgi:hypothetical protein
VGDQPFNITKGRVGEFVVRINANDPANSVLVWSLWNITASDATQIDLDDIAAIEASGTNAELTSGTNANYVRKTLTDASGITRTVDDTNNWVDISCAAQTWTALGAGTAINHAICAYDSDSTGGADSAQLPVSQHSFAITPDGSDVTMNITAPGFYRST